MLEEYRSNYEQRIRTLVGFGHRGSSTDRERAAADYLCGQLSSIGLNPEREAFTGTSSHGGRILIHVLLATLAPHCSGCCRSFPSHRFGRGPLAVVRKHNARDLAQSAACASSFHKYCCQGSAKVAAPAHHRERTLRYAAHRTNLVVECELASARLASAGIFETTTFVVGICHPRTNGSQQSGDRDRGRINRSRLPTGAY